MAPDTRLPATPRGSRRRIALLVLLALLPSGSLSCTVRTKVPPGYCKLPVDRGKSDPLPHRPAPYFANGVLHLSQEGCWRVNPMPPLRPSLFPREAVPRRLASTRTRAAPDTLMAKPSRRLPLKQMTVPRVD